MNIKRWFKIVPAIICSLSIGCTRTGFQKVDGRWVYVTWNEANGRKVHPLNADDATFTAVNQQYYAKDKDRVFFQLNAIDGADSATFQVINDDNYAKDKESVFIRKHRISEADPASFKIIQVPYSRDSKRIYCGTVAMQDVDLEAFEVIKHSHGWSIIYDKALFRSRFGKTFENLEISQDRPAVVGYGWGRDGKHYYCGPGKVEGADYASFRIEGEYEASDKNRKYRHVFPVE